ncbi:MAG: hypothetical protein JXP37_04405 [Coriobacteriia bacterium]|nr:hypothetical protein [Coriobacteriia bacterium]
MRRHTFMLAGILALSIALSGCTGSTQPEATPPPAMPPVGDVDTQPPAAPPEPPMGTQSLSYLEGFWTVTVSDARIDPAVVTPELADPSGTWEFIVMGESMTAHVGDRRYEGLLTPTEGGWSYRGLATGTDAQGEMRSGYVELTATDSAEGAFTGVLVRYVDPDGGTPAYTGAWTVAGSRQ